MSESISLAKVLSSGVRKYGKSILSNLAIAVKVTRLYSFAHQNVTDALKELLDFLQSFIRLEGSVDLLRVGDFLFLNEVRIRVDFAGYQAFGFVLDLMKERDIGGISFNKGITAQELESLIELFNEAVPAASKPWEAFGQTLKKRRFSHIEFTQHQERPDLAGETDEDGRVVAIRTYFKAIAIVDDIIRAMSTGRKLNLRRMKLAVHAMVDMTLNEERLLLALTNSKNHGGPGSNHAVNVCVLSLATGAKLGISKKILGDLGITALLHDVGKATLPEDLLKKCHEDHSPEEAGAFRRHTGLGVDQLLNQRMMDSIVKGINVAFLHHYRYDGTGFPKLVATKEQNLFTRIVAVANYYDNVTTPGRVKKKAQTPESVMQTLMELRGTEFDPLVVKAFVNLMGLYPVGCVVRLDSGEVATVIQPASNPRFLDRPVVRLVSDARGNPSEQQVDLMERGPAGTFTHSILKIYQQEEVELDLEEYLAVI